jgi:hypothetical protein
MASHGPLSRRDAFICSKMVWLVAPLIAKMVLVKVSGGATFSNPVLGALPLSSKIGTAFSSEATLARVLLETDDWDRTVPLKCFRNHCLHRLTSDSLKTVGRR